MKSWISTFLNKTWKSSDWANSGIQVFQNHEGGTKLLPALQWDQEPQQKTLAACASHVIWLHTENKTHHDSPPYPVWCVFTQADQRLEVWLLLGWFLRKGLLQSLPCSWCSYPRWSVCHPVRHWLEACRERTKENYQYHSNRYHRKATVQTKS